MRKEKQEAKNNKLENDPAYSEALKLYWHECKTGKVKRGTTYHEWRKDNGYPTEFIDVEVVDDNGIVSTTRRYVDDAIEDKVKKIRERRK